MLRTLRSILIIITILQGCHQGFQTPKGLKKLTDMEVLEIIRRKEQMPPGLKITMADGKPVDNNVMMAIGQKKLVTDFYVDSARRVRLLIVRPYVDNDKYLLSEIDKINNSAMQSTPIDVDCAKVSGILADIRIKDQENRGLNSSQNHNFDEENQRMVLSIIKKCGFPQSPIIDNAGLETIFLVIQHGSKEMRSKYLNHFINLSRKGEFSRSIVALMEDRVLMDSGKKQKYGSQVIQSTTGVWELYPVDNIDSVNVRRRRIGLNTLEEYLKEFQH
jgi:hypothetical protein